MIILIRKYKILTVIASKKRTWVAVIYKFEKITYIVYFTHNNV